MTAAPALATGLFFAVMIMTLESSSPKLHVFFSAIVAGVFIGFGVARGLEEWR